MAEERRDNSIYVLGLLIAVALIFYGLWTEEHPVVVEIVELVTNKTVEFLDPKIITRVNKEIVHLTATPGTSVNDVIYATPALAALAPVGSDASASTDAALAATAYASVEATLRALTPVAPSPTVEPSQTPEPASTMYLPPAPSTLAPMPATQVPPTQAPATQAPATVEPPTVEPPTQVPPTQVPPTQVPPTQVPPTQVPPTQVPPTQVPPTQVPPTVEPPTVEPPTQVPPTQVPPTQVPPTQVPTQTPTVEPQAPAPITPVATDSQELIAPQLTDEKTNPEQPPASSGVATVQGNIEFIDEESLTLILTNGDYYNSFQVAPSGEFWFEGVPNGSYNLSANAGGLGAGCAEITVSVPEGHATLTYNYRYYKHQCSSN